MNKYKHYFLSLFLCVSLLIGFSTIANADEVDVKPYLITQQNQFVSTTHNNTFGTKWFTPNNDVEEKSEVPNYHVTTYILQNNKAKYKSIYMLNYLDNSVMLDADKTYNVKFRNVYYSMFANFLTTGYQVYLRNPSKAIIVLGYTDDTVEQITDYEITNANGSPEATLSFNCTPKKDVQLITITFENDIKDILGGYSGIDEVINLTSYFGEYNGDNGHQFILEIESQETGLLRTVIEFLKSIMQRITETFLSVTEGFDNISTWFSNVVNKIIELPSEIWTFISDGLKELFVPDENQMAQYKDDWDMLLSQRFGALYEVGDIFEELVANNILNQSSTVGYTGLIEIPKVSLNNYGIPFEFGGYIVDVKPDGFEWLITIVKRVISISCTLLFVNVLRKKYDSVIGG